MLWSLAIEEQFYMVWPFLARGLTPRRLLAVCAFLILASPPVRSLTYDSLGYPAVYVATFCRLDTLAMGAMLAILVADERWRARVLSACRVLSLPALVAIGWIFARPFGASYPGEFPPWFPVWGYSILALGFAIIVGACIEPHRLVRVLLGNRVMRFIGTLSYSIYVWHLFLAQLINRQAERTPWLSGSFAARAAIWLVVTSIVASASYFLFERPILRLKDRI